MRTGRAFFEDHITRLGAALAFYTTVAVAPLLVLAIAVAGFFFEETDAREKVIREIVDCIWAGRTWHPDTARRVR
jgi:membrane protein